MQFGLSFDKIVALVTQHDLLGHRTQVGRLVGIQSAVGRICAEPLAEKHQIIDAGLQVGAVLRLMLAVRVVEVDARTALAHLPEGGADRRHPSPGGLCHGFGSGVVIGLEGREIGKAAVGRRREGPRLLQNHLARRRRGAHLVGQGRKAREDRRRGVAAIVGGILALVLQESEIVTALFDDVGREPQRQMLGQRLRPFEVSLDVESMPFAPCDLLEHPRRVAVVGERVAQTQHLLGVAGRRRAEVLHVAANP